MTSKRRRSFMDYIASYFGYISKPINKVAFRQLCMKSIADDVIRPQEGSQIIKILELENTRVRDIMITRSAIRLIEVDQRIEEIKNLIKTSGHSRFPVIAEDNKKIIGILLSKDLVVSRGKKSVKDLVRKALFVPENKKLNNLLSEFQKRHQHMAIVINEYGDFTGIVTIEDVIEQITGEIEDEHDPQQTGKQILKEGRDRYLVQATTPITEFNDYFNAQLKDDDIDTVGGLVLKQLGFIPQKGTEIRIDRFKFTVRSANERQIKWFDVHKIAKKARKSQE
jgi:magnesium and cobalt transporter